MTAPQPDSTSLEQSRVHPSDQSAFARATDDWLRQRKAYHAIRVGLGLLASFVLVLRERSWQIEQMKPDLQFLIAAIVVAVAFEVAEFLWSIVRAPVIQRNESRRDVAVLQERTVSAIRERDTYQHNLEHMQSHTRALQSRLDHETSLREKADAENRSLRERLDATDSGQGTGEQMVEAEERLAVATAYLHECIHNAEKRSRNVMQTTTDLQQYIDAVSVGGLTYFLSKAQAEYRKCFLLARTDPPRNTTDHFANIAHALKSFVAQLTPGDISPKVKRTDQ